MPTIKIEPIHCAEIHGTQHGVEVLCEKVNELVDAYNAVVPAAVKSTAKEEKK